MAIVYVEYSVKLHGLATTSAALNMFLPALESHIRQFVNERPDLCARAEFDSDVEVELVELAGDGRSS